MLANVLYPGTYFFWEGLRALLSSPAALVLAFPILFGLTHDRSHIVRWHGPVLLAVIASLALVLERHPDPWEVIAFAMLYAGLMGLTAFGIGFVPVPMRDRLRRRPAWVRAVTMIGGYGSALAPIVWVAEYRSHQYERSTQILAGELIALAVLIAVLTLQHRWMADRPAVATPARRWDVVFAIGLVSMVGLGYFIASTTQGPHRSIWFILTEG